MDYLRIIEAESYEKMSRIAAAIIGAQVLLKPHCVLGLATGSSPIGVYAELVKQYEEGILDFSRVTTVNLDEYVGLSGEHPQSYRYFMERHLFSKVNIKRENTYLPDGTAADPEAEGDRYEEKINMLGGVDLQLLGIGRNGHIGFNEPCDRFPRFVHPVDLTESTIQANSRLFDRVEDVPTQAITMGIGTIMKARRILLIAGEEKKEIIHRALYDKITPQVPASVLQMHHDVTVIIGVKK